MATPSHISAGVTFTDHTEGTLYRIVARHGDAESLAQHEQLGLQEGWSVVTAQLAAVAERQ
ncbi:SRPBCC domain-containing protein [Arthrobacter sp. FW305-123]|nr:SRPBCC domain-containing protein [Arthrobacter sp. FW305-123]